jgi:hypothetical protein
MIDAQDEAEVARVVNQIVDPVGYFYRFSLPTSTLKRKRVA